MARFFWLMRVFISACWASPILAQSVFYPLQQDWSPKGSAVNISVFVFNDLNQNGTYDLGDRPFSNLSVGLIQAGTPLRLARSNANGFANFPMGAGQQRAVIADVGTYEFVVFPPPGWAISTRNQTQTRDIISAPESKTGLAVVGDVPAPVGLRRYLFVRGTFGMAETGTVTLLQDQEILAEKTLTPGEEFLWPLTAGQYTLQSGTTRHPFRITTLPVDVGTLRPGPRSTATGQSIDFENIAPTGLLKAPNGYGGLNWFNLNIMSSTMMPGAVGYVNGATSGSHILYTSAGHPSRIYNDTPFDLLSVNLSAAWPVSEGETVVFDYYRDGAHLWQERIGVSAYGAISYQPRMAGITRVEISTAHYWQAVLDDLVVE